MSMDFYEARLRAPEAGKPLIFAFHGTGGNEDQLFTLAEQLLPGAGVVAPRGDVSEFGALRFFKRSGEGVYDMDDLARATDRMIAFIEAHRAAYPSHPVYGFGYSNGANILASVFLKRPDLFDRTALLHPLVTWEPDAKLGLKGRKLLITAGQNDPITPYGMTQSFIAWLEAQGVEVTRDIHDGGHELRNSELLLLEAFLNEGPAS